MTHPAPRTFDQVWTRFLHQLGMYSPASAATLQPGATAEQIAHLETVHGFALHPDVRALLEHHNGTVYVDGNAVEGTDFLPMGYMLDSIDRILAGHEWRTTFSAENRAIGIPEETLYGHAHQWVPIAHSIDAGILFVEHRPGPTYGHVIELGIGSGAFEGTLWANTLLEFFDALTHSLDTRTPFHDQTPGVRESNLTEEIYLHWDWDE
ncbi:SMI1/KNR4 family protein [Nocardia iowensis]|uniref:SMI1/KNR4 family protein n=1 Tax=Nocardia iowensis TaxID=204891 RepID=A0ABX8RKK4_NOCIO|nr:SMI1/KNR4 family protein [Nocardia iowensis]QXN88805.1 SMI1/KNR4 family protein [Nocardia iowensis]